MNSVTGLLYSQVGYDTGLPKRAMVRGPEGTLDANAATFALLGRGEDTPTLSGRAQGQGERWGSCWWDMDFSDLDTPGKYVLAVRDARGERFRSAPFEVAENLLWNRTWFLMAIDQAERRQKLARNQVGWYDAGAEWQEADSHAALLVGLTDVLEFARPQIPAADLPRLEAQILNGCDYLARLQDRAAALPDGAGAVVHQIWKFDELILPGDVSKAALSWARAARTLSESHAEKKSEYLSRARQALNWLENAKPPGDRGFSRLNHGFAPDAPIPNEWMTRDLLMQLWAMLELTRADAADYRADCAALAAQILTRQVGREQPEGPYYGHFRTFDSAAVTEKAWVHNGDGNVWGVDIGGHFPHYVLPLLLMREVWPEHPDAPRWEQGVHDFAYGYFLPACRANPFLLLPLGWFTGEGLLSFAGLWHGMNAAYGLAAALALEFARFFGDDSFYAVAVGNLQWIAGLNAGVTRDSLFASTMFSRDIPEGAAIPCSMIQGVGTEQAGNWMQIRGSICNGFSVGDQFRFDVAATAANDGPHAFTDEDWISHVGGWLSAVSRLQTIR